MGNCCLGDNRPTCFPIADVAGYGQTRPKPKRLRLNRDLTLACRLCLRLGIDDPEQWLEDVPDRVWELWKAYYAVEPFGGERELAAKTVVLLKQLVASKFKAEEIEKALRMCDRLTGTEMPWEWIDQPQPEQEPDTVANFEATVAGLYG